MKVAIVGYDAFGHMHSASINEVPGSYLDEHIRDWLKTHKDAVKATIFVPQPGDVVLPHWIDPRWTCDVKTLRREYGVVECMCCGDLINEEDAIHVDENGNSVDRAA